MHLSLPHVLFFSAALGMMSPCRSHCACVPRPVSASLPLAVFFSLAPWTTPPFQPHHQRKIYALLQRYRVLELLLSQTALQQVVGDHLRYGEPFRGFLSSFPQMCSMPLPLKVAVILRLRRPSARILARDRLLCTRCYVACSMQQPLICKLSIACQSA